MSEATKLVSLQEEIRVDPYERLPKNRPSMNVCNNTPWYLNPKEVQFYEKFLGKTKSSYFKFA